MSTGKLTTTFFFLIVALSLFLVTQRQREPTPPSMIDAAPTPTLHLYHIRSSTSHHSIGYTGAPKASPNNSYCIHPPPFGDQCTVLSEHALAACVVEEECTGYVCPDSHAYLPDGGNARSKGVTGPICQLRNSPSLTTDELNHGMCLPDGCSSFLISPKAAKDLEREGVIYIDEDFVSRVREHDFVYEEEVEGAFTLHSDHYKGYETVHTQIHRSKSLFVLRAKS